METATSECRNREKSNKQEEVILLLQKKLAKKQEGPTKLLLPPKEKQEGLAEMLLLPKKKEEGLTELLPMLVKRQEEGLLAQKLVKKSEGSIHTSRICVPCICGFNMQKLLTEDKQEFLCTCKRDSKAKKCVGATLVDPTEKRRAWGILHHARARSWGCGRLHLLYSS